MIIIKIGKKIKEDTTLDKDDDDTEWTYNPKYDPKKQTPDQKALQRLSTADKKNAEIKFIQKAGYIPVVKDSPIMFGKGAQGKVYEVTKDGKRYALKVAYKGRMGSEQEVDVRRQIEKLRPQMPPEVSKHIVKCYSIFSNGHMNGIVLEIMRPMNSIEEDILFSGISTIDPYSSNMGQEKWNQKRGIYKTKDKPAKGWPTHQDPKAFDPSRAWPNWDDEKMRIDYPGKKYKLNQSKEKRTFEKQKSLIDALHYIADNFKIYWADLHQLNIMVRPSTDDYVATDIGLFDAPLT